MATLTKGQTIIVGLGTYALTTTTTGIHNVIVTSTIDRSSALIITITQSGSASVSVSSVAPSTSQRHINLQQLLNIVSGDVITVTLSSSAPADNQLNQPKTLINIHVGANQ